MAARQPPTLRPSLVPGPASREAAVSAKVSVGGEPARCPPPPAGDPCLRRLDRGLWVGGGGAGRRPVLVPTRCYTEGRKGGVLARPPGAGAPDVVVFWVFFLPTSVLALGWQVTISC